MYRSPRRAYRAGQFHREERIDPDIFKSATMAHAVFLAMVQEVGVPGANCLNPGNAGPNGWEYQIWNKRYKAAGIKRLS